MNKILYNNDVLLRIQSEAMEFSGIGIYRYKFDGTLTYIDHGTIRLLDLQDRYPDPSELVGKKMSELMEYVRPVGSFRDILKKGGSLRNLEYPYRTLSGKERWVLHDSYMVHDPECGEDVVQIIVKDITALKKMSGERDRLAGILENTSDLVATANPDNRISYMNRAGRMMLRLNADEPIDALYISEVHTPESYELVSRVGIPAAIMHGVWHGQTELISRDGERIPVSQVILAHNDEHGELLYISTIMRDIREQVAVERRLRRSEEAFRNLFNNMRDSIATYELVHVNGTPVDYRFLDVNSTFEETMSLRQGDIMSRTISEVIHRNPDPEQLRKFSQVVESGDAVSFEDDSIIPGRLFEVNSFRPSPGRFACVYRDITEKTLAEKREKELQRKLASAEKMKSLGLLVGGVAHDLNNVLGPIIVLPDLVAEYVKRHTRQSEPEYKETLESLDVMKDSAKQAASVVSDLVVMGRRGQIQKVALDVNRVIAEMMASKQIRAMQDQRPDVKIAAKLAAEPVLCLASDSGLVRVLANLVGNAVEAIKGQGEVEVRTGRKVFTEPYHGYEKLPAGAYVAVEVADNGCGMDAGTMARIFEPYFSTKEPSERSGSGLGLSVVYGLVKDHDGFLDVKSESGKGTTFTVYLPAAGQAALSATSAETQAIGHHERILVVDDEPGQLVLAKRILMKLGYDATVVPAGRDAVLLFEEAKREGGPAPFDIVMTDMIMEDMDGMAVCREIRHLYPGQKLIIASGHSAEEQEKQAKAIRADWLVKPYTADELARAVRAQLNIAP